MFDITRALTPLHHHRTVGRPEPRQVQRRAAQLLAPVELSPPGTARHLDFAQFPPTSITTSMRRIASRRLAGTSNITVITSDGHLALAFEPSTTAASLRPYPGRATEGICRQEVRGRQIAGR